MVSLSLSYIIGQTLFIEVKIAASKSGDFVMLDRVITA